MRRKALDGRAVPMPQGGAPRHHQVNVRVDDGTFGLLDTVSRIEGVDRADLVREGIDMLLRSRMDDPTWRAEVLEPHLEALRRLATDERR